jgi:hypothetical protein
VYGALLVAHQNVLYFRPVQRIINRQHRPARVAEDKVYAFFLEAPDNRFPNRDHCLTLPNRLHLD